MIYARFQASDLAKCHYGGGYDPDVFKAKLFNENHCPKDQICYEKFCQTKKIKGGRVDNARCIYCGGYFHLKCLWKPTPHDKAWQHSVGVSHPFRNSKMGVCNECHQSMTKMDDSESKVQSRLGRRCACNGTSNIKVHSCVDQRYNLTKRAYCIVCSAPVHANCAVFGEHAGSFMRAAHWSNGWWKYFPVCCICVTPGVSCIRVFNFPTERISPSSFEKILCLQANFNFFPTQEPATSFHGDLSPTRLLLMDLNRLEREHCFWSDTILEFYLLLPIRYSGRYQAASSVFVFPYANSGMSNEDSEVNEDLQNLHLNNPRILPLVQRGCFPKQWARQRKNATPDWVPYVDNDFDFFKKDIMVFPVHSPGHYSLWIACNVNLVKRTHLKPAKVKRVPFLACLDYLRRPTKSVDIVNN